MPITVQPAPLPVGQSLCANTEPINLMGYGQNNSASLLFVVEILIMKEFAWNILSPF